MKGRFRFMNLTDRLLVTETDEVMTVSDFLRIFNELKSQGITLGDAIGNLEYSITHGILKKMK
jgi:hypothetical protein